MPSHTQAIIFHPSSYLVDTVDNLLRELAPDLEYENLIIPDLLSRALSGLSAEIRDEIRALLEGAAYSRKIPILCTCSTLGGLAEELGKHIGLSVMRIDRAMAESAVLTGEHIGLAASLESTLRPTQDLLCEVAESQGKTIRIHPILCEQAWQHKLTGNDDAYVHEAARMIRNAASDLDVIVLAQGSMAKASALLDDLGIPVLSSPRLGVEAFLRVME